MKRIFGILLFAICLHLHTNSQNLSNVNIPKTVTPGPNASALGKYGEIPVDKSTGIPAISIPIFNWTRERSKTSINIGLSYHAGGHKVEEMPSDVGLGWALNAGGVITRTVIGLPDEQYNGFRGSSTIMPNLSTTNPGPIMPNYFVPMHNMVSLSNHINFHNSYTNYVLLKSIHDGQLDSQQDIYSFNYLGNSGKFVVGKDGSVLNLKYSNIKIEIIDAGTYNENFRITDEYGKQYFFDVKEKVFSTGTSINYDNLANATWMSFQPTTSQVTSWYLSKIVSADKIDTIFFNYSEGGTTKDQRGFYESVHVLKSDPITANIGWGQVKGTFVKGSSFDEIQLIKLRSIYFPDQTQLFFNYLLPRVDNVSDSALTSIQIINGSYSTKYNLSYSYFNADESHSPFSHAFLFPEIVNDPFKRLRLDSVMIVDANGKSNGSFTFEYNETALPPRHSMNVDYWGYYRRGVNDNITLIPEVKLPSSLYNVFNDIYLLGANRNSTDNHAKASVISKIKYPTGGFTLFEFESNKAFNENDWFDNEAKMEVTLTPVLFNSNVSVEMQDRVETNVAFKFSLIETAGRIPIDPNGPLGTCSYTDMEDILVTVRIKSTDNMINIPIMKSYRNYMVGFVSEHQLPLGKDYVIYFEWPNSTCSNLVPFNVTAVANFLKPKTDKVVGGVRIKQLINYDLSGNTLTTQYSYTDINNSSSGNLAVLPDNRYHETTTGIWNTCQGNPFSLPQFRGFRHTLNRTSTPNTPLSFQKGSSIIYRNVEEKKVNGAQNIGRTLSEYLPMQDSWADIYPYAKDIYFYSAPGMLKKETVFSDASVVLQIIENEYNYAFNKHAIENHRSLKVALTSSDNCNTFAHMAFLAQVIYPVADNVLLKKTSLKQFSDPTRALSVITDYEYDNQTSLIKKKSVLNSKGENTSALYEYPFDRTGQAIYNDMIGRNMINYPISQSEYKGNTLLRTVNLNYDYFNGSNIYENSITASTYSNSPDILATYLSYDSKGNVSQILTKEGVQINYIWSDKGSLLAKTYNCLSGNSAYTSFEADGMGNWGFGPWKIRYDLLAVTGKKVYDLEGGMWHNALDPSVTYKVSFWAKGSRPGININHPGGGYTILQNSNEVKLIRSLNGWNYYEAIVTNAANMGIWKHGHEPQTFIDEVRLHPSDAQMTTYTYEPLIGMTSQCDLNSRLQYYQYDAFNRLQYIRDENRNFLKMYCYTYNGQQEECNGTAVGNDAISQTFYRNCGSGYFPGLYVYTIPANMYFGATKTAANAKRDQELATNGQLFANTNANCTAQTIYAKLSYENWDIGPNVIADVVIRFYSDAECMQPVSVSNLQINLEEHKFIYGNPAIVLNHIVTANGSAFTFKDDVIMSGTLEDGDGERWYNLVQGAGYFITF